jgi:hypothetical protein
MSETSEQRKTRVDALYNDGCYLHRLTAQSRQLAREEQIKFGNLRTNVEAAAEHVAVESED